MLIVNILSGAGGVGKSTLALCLAAHWSKDGASVAIHDFDESQQLSDAIRQQSTSENGFEILPYLPENGFDILIIDNAPSTKNALIKHDVLIYPMLAHGKSIRALERTKRLIQTSNVVFVCTRCNMQSAIDKQNYAIIRQDYDGLLMRESSFYKKVMENGGNFLNYKKNKPYYMAKNEIALIAQRIEKYI